MLSEIYSQKDRHATKQVTYIHYIHVTNILVAELEDSIPKTEYQNLWHLALF
jgi:hypothetical protein